MDLVGMEPEEGFTKVQVVYYLSRGGQLQQPHLIDVPVAAHANGIYLRDVKRRLTSIRGKGMGESFSWSCKRNYKNNFIWQDLADDDKIVPLSDGELVLKGSELYTGAQEKDEGQVDPESASQMLPSKIKKLVSKKFDFEAVKRSLDLESDKLQEQSDLAAALSMSLQLMSDPHLKRFSKDKSMDLNQQVMNSLSQAKSNAAAEVSNAAEECLLDQSVTDISSETLHSEESTVQKFSFNEAVRERSKSTASASSSGTDRDNYCPPRKVEVIGRDRSHSREIPRSKEVSRELPPQIPRDAVSREKSREMSRELPRESVRESTRDAPRETPREFPREAARESLSREVPIEVFPGEVSREIPRESLRELSRELPKDVPPREASRISKDAGKSRQEKTEELPTIKTKRSPGTSEAGDSSPFMLSPRRLLAVLSTPGAEKKSGKLVHSSSTRSSAPSTSAHDEGFIPTINIRLAKQATCLSNFRLCSHINPHATDSRPDSPDHPLSAPPAQTASGGSSTIPVSPNTRGHSGGGPYWPRWRSSRKNRNSSDGKEVNPATPPRSSKPPARKPDPALNQSFEFDSKIGVGNSSMATPSLQTGNNSPSLSESSNGAATTSKMSPPVSLSVQSDGSDGAPPSTSSSSENQNIVSVKEVITQQSASATSPEGRPSLDTESLPRVSISESISEVREATKGVRPDSPESPMKPNPPSSPARTQLSSSPSFNKRIEDARARARSLVSKEIKAGESRSSKDLLKENNRARTSSTSARSNSIRMPINKTGTTGEGSKPPLGTLNRSPPRINSFVWDDSPITAPKKEFINRDDRPLTAGRTNLDWERTLQEAASLSVPPPDFGQILQECGQCGRTFKPDSLKVHMRGCHSLRRNKDFL
ncbi:hypothetical protein R1flu_014027 [Riccia fluitans]|uniref:SOSEKI DIX-like domain-containing protein n=1 Tax=Riccia fluitans TaxID=41844 RepID=A0ABD1YEY4_9MARC